MENQEPTYSTQKEEPVMPAPPPSTFPTPAHPLPKFLPKPIALIFIILIVGVLLSGLVFTVYTLGRNSVLKELNPTQPETPPAGPVFQASPTPASNATNADPATADWKIYADSFGNYVAKYPVGWSSATTFDTTVTKTHDFLSADYKETPSTQEGVSIPTIDSGQSLSIRTQTNPSFKNYDKYNDFIVNLSTGHFQSGDKNRKEIMVDGEKCLLSINLEWFGGYVSACSMYHNGKTIDLTFRSKTKNNQLFDQILDTFKFTE